MNEVDRERTSGAVEVLADVLCPFTHVGVLRLVERRAELGRDAPVLQVRAWPLELVAGFDPARGEDHAAVLADLERRRSLGVVGSPHFVVNGVGISCSGLEIGRVDGKLRIALDAEGFASLAERCFSVPGS